MLTIRDILAIEKEDNFQEKRCSELLLYSASNIKDFQILPKIKLDTDLPQTIIDEIRKYFLTY